MSNELTFPSDTCVLVCSGPSLKLVDPFSLGYPVVAVSTAIRAIPNPHYWVLADFLNEMHGEEGNVAYQNENIVKIIPTDKISPKHAGSSRNFQEYKYSDADRTINNTQAHLFSGNLPMLKGPHKSATFAIQVLHYIGVKNVIWVGNDLNAPTAKEKYAYESNAVDLRKAHNFNVTLDQVHQSLKNWYPKAKELGYNWYSWMCGDVFETLVPRFDIDAHIAPPISVFSVPAVPSIHQIMAQPMSRVIRQKIPNADRRKLREFRRNNVIPVVDKKKLSRERLARNAEARKVEFVAKAIKRSPPFVAKTPKTPISNKKIVKYVKMPQRNMDINSASKIIRDVLR